MTDRALLDATTLATDVVSGRTTAVTVATDSLARIDAYALVQPEVWITRLPADVVLAMAAAVDRRIAAGERWPSTHPPSHRSQ